MKPTLSVIKKSAALAVVFVNPETDSPQSAYDLDEGPPDCFPTPMRPDEVVARYAGRYEIVWLTPPATPERIQTNVVTDEEVQAVLDGREPSAPVDTAAIPPSIPTPPAPVNSLSIMPPAPSGSEVAVLRELELMFAARQASSGDKRASLDAEINAVGNFLVRVFPSALPLLQQLSARYSDAAIRHSF